MVLTSLIVTISLNVMLANAHLNYHTDVGIPLATRIREAERAIVENFDNDLNIRIINGADASIANYPWQAGLIIQLESSYSPFGTALCGASLVTRNRLITAGHCWVNSERDMSGNEIVIQGTSLEVVLGSNFIYYLGVRMTTSEVVPHPNWERTRDFSECDIAMIYLPQDVNFNDVISPVSLPFNIAGESFVGYYAVATGYGAVHDVSINEVVHDRSSSLQYVGLTVISNNECMNYYFGIHPWDVCTRGINTVAGTCQGDSGGPLVTYINNEPILIGVTSRGTLKCEIGSPSIFTRVTKVLDFITVNL